MRVLFVNPGLAMGGAEPSLLLLLQGLQAYGVEATVALFGDGPFRNQLSAIAVPTVCVRSSGWLRSATRYQLSGALLRVAALVTAGLPTTVSLAALARRTKADLIHTNGLKAHLLGGLAGRMIGTPVVWHLRDFLPGDYAGQVLRRAAQYLPALVLANSEAVAATLRPKNGGCPSVIRIHNPVDMGRFCPGLPRGRIRQELGLGEDVPLVGCVAHLTPWKGHELFLSIARAVTDAVPEAHFVITGGPIYETDGHSGYPEALRRRTVELGLADRVAFLGARDDIPEVLAALDVLVHCPTAPEPFGRVLAEAMAVECPVVAACCGGIPEVVDDGVTGFLVPPGDVQGFVAAVLHFLEEPTLRKRFGQAGRRRAEALFGVEAHVLGVLEAYRAVMTRRHSV